MQQVLSTMPEATTIYAERVSQGFYLNVDVNRAAAARYGLTVADVQRVVSSEIGGMDIAENVEGPRALSDCRSLSAPTSATPPIVVAGANSHAFRCADPRERSCARRSLARPRNDPGDEDGSLTGMSI